MKNSLAYYFPAKRSLGQNFLQEQDYVEQIMQALSLQAEDYILEIGPGRGALTEQLVKQCAHCFAVELDQKLVPILSDNYPNLTLYQADILCFDWQLIKKVCPPEQKLRIVGNIPYNITSPILFMLLQNIYTFCQDIHLMLQKEVVQRITSAPHNKHYGRLGIMLQACFKTECLFEVPKTAFLPMPRVDSAFIRLVPDYERFASIKNLENLSKFTALCFSRRRKYLKNSLNKESEYLIELLGLDPTARPENISVDQYIALSNALCDTNHTKYYA
jgi:16S rRNA (adenine1518-N6/adenine1519-N6)-dimethyltransferase